jgi:hypothetical protein
MAHLDAMALPNAHADSLRLRAAACRRFVYVLEHAELQRLRHWSGTETWIGPTATAFERDLLSAFHDLGLASDELRSAASRLDRAAELAEAASPASVLLTPT